MRPPGECKAFTIREKEEDETDSTDKKNYFIQWSTFLIYKNLHVSRGLTTTPKKIMFYLLLFQLTILLYFVWLFSEAD